MSNGRPARRHLHPNPFRRSRRTDRHLRVWRVSKSHHKLACPPEEPWPPRLEVSARPASSNEVTSTSLATPPAAPAAGRSDRHGARGSAKRGQVDQCDLDLATIAGVDRARAVDDRKSHAWQPNPNVDGPTPPFRTEWPRDLRRHEGAMAGASSTSTALNRSMPASPSPGWASVVRGRGGRPPDGWTRGHRLLWPRVRHAQQPPSRALPRAAVGAVVVVATRPGTAGLIAFEVNRGGAPHAELGAVRRAALNVAGRAVVAEQDRGAGGQRPRKSVATPSCGSVTRTCPTSVISRSAEVPSVGQVRSPSGGSSIRPRTSCTGPGRPDGARRARRPG